MNDEHDCLSEDDCLCEGEYTCQLCESLDEEYLRDLDANEGCDDEDDWLQRQGVYEWEPRDEEGDMTLDECQHLVFKHWRRFRGRNKQPLVGPCWGGNPRFDLLLLRIWLPRWAKNKGTVLHETAHAIAYGDRHGPLFVRVYIDLLAAEGYGEIDDLVASAKAVGVKIARNPSKLG